MRLRRYLCLLLLCAVICCGLFSVSASAAVVEQYSYNGYIFDALPEYDETTYKYIWIDSCGTLFMSEHPFVFDGSHMIPLVDCDVLTFQWDYVLNCWGLSFSNIVSVSDFLGDAPIWSNFDVSWSTGSLYLSASEIECRQIFTPPVDATDLAAMFFPAVKQINVGSIILVLVAGVGCSIGLVFLWWGIRKATGMLIKAFKKGKLRI